MRKVTLRELAVLAGCSHATVSLALRQDPRIPAGTRNRILEIAAEAGYQRDPLVSQLMGKLRIPRQRRQGERIAYLVAWSDFENWRRQPHDTSCFEGIVGRARELGYDIEEFWLKQPGLSARRLGDILHSRGIRGILLGPSSRPIGHASLDWTRFATVAIGQTLTKPDFHRVVHAHFSGMTLALRQLRHRGYRRIGFASIADQSRRINQGWLGSYLGYSHELPARERILPLVDEHWDQKKLVRWTRKNRLDAVISNSEVPLTLLRDGGLPIPGEIGFASLDRIQPEDPFAGIDQLRRQIGVAAVELLASLLETNQSGLPVYPKILHFEGAWVDGPTVRKRCAARLEPPDPSPAAH